MGATIHYYFCVLDCTPNEGNIQADHPETEGKENEHRSRKDRNGCTYICKKDNYAEFPSPNAYVGHRGNFPYSSSIACVGLLIPL